MRTSTKILFAASLSACAVSSAFAQQAPGWNLAWGAAQPVPLSPWATALLGLLLVAATYTFLRRRSTGGGIALVAAAAIFGSSYLTQESWAINPYNYTISTASGSAFVSCAILDSNVEQQETNGIEEIVIGTTLQDGVVLRRVDFSSSAPVSGAAAPEPTIGFDTCSVGLRVTPEAPCSLSCNPG